MKLQDGFGLLKIGSNDPTKYLGDGDTTFIEYIRDIIVEVLESKAGMNEKKYFLAPLVHDYLDFLRKY
jgi:hypothetical protein